MKKNFICLTIHTERLHSDFLWRKIQKIIKLFNKLNFKATWFSVNPSFVGYKFDEEKWIERLKFLINNNQQIEQHTHFYKGKEGVKKGLGYDLGKENVEKRILEDKRWLKEKIGISPKGFISGAWRTNERVLGILKEQGYKYDLTSKDSVLLAENGFLKIPSLSNLGGLIKSLLKFRFKKKFILYQNLSFYTLYLHDYDLENFLFRKALVYLIYILSFFGFKFISTKELYAKILKQ